MKNEWLKRASAYPPMPLSVSELDLSEGDILHLRIGGEMGDGQPPFVPSVQELEDAVDLWQVVVPEGVTVIATHHLVKPELIRTSQVKKNV